MLKCTAPKTRTRASRISNWLRLRSAGPNLRFEALELRCYLSAGTTGTEFRVNTTLPEVQASAPYSLQSIASDPAGNFVIVWDSNIANERDIYARRYSASGQPLSSETLVPSVSAGSQSGASIGMAADGSYVIAWQGSNSVGIMARRFDSAGAPQGGEFQVNTTQLDNYRPNVAVSATGDFLVTWTRKVLGSAGEIYGQRYSAAGARVGEEFRISTGQGDQSVAAMDREGNFVVAWEFYQGSVINDYELHARRFNAAGEPEDEEFPVNTPAPGPQQGPSIAMNDDGDFVIAWIGRNSNSASPSPYARTFARDGSPLGEQLQVASTANMFGVKVAMDAANRFVVTWSEQSVGTDQSDVFARVYALDAQAEPAFRVSQSTAGHQLSPSAAFDQAGNVVFTWTDNGPLSTGNDIFARQFAATDLGIRVTSRFLFYNRSYYDGADPAANLADDGSIAPDKRALLPGQTASFANYTSYSRGINGLMIDVSGLVGTPTVGDFTFFVGNSSDVSAWTAAPSPTLTIRRGGGGAGADRMTLIWPDGAIRNCWLQVIMLANARTGIELPDGFYFGNAVGESGNSTTEARVSIIDELLARNNPHNAVPFPAELSNRFDYNRDCRVSAVDQLLARNNITTAVTQLQLIAPPALLMADGPIAQGLTDWYSEIASEVTDVQADQQSVRTGAAISSGESQSNRRNLPVQDASRTTEVAAQSIGRRRLPAAFKPVDAIFAGIADFTQ